MKRHWFLLLLVLLRISAAAQPACTYILQGVVRDASSGESLPAAVVHLSANGWNVMSDGAGKFLFDSLCETSYVVEVQYVGYEKYTASFETGSPVMILLRRSMVKMKETDIVEKKIEAKSTGAVDSLSQQEMDRAKGKGLTDYLRQLAGVSAIQTGPSVMKPVIHGMHSQRVLIMNAGIRQEGQQWGTEHAPEIDPFIARKLTVVKGSSAIRYGADAVGGVIILEPRELPHKPGINAEVNLVGMSNGRQGVASGLVEQHLGKFHDICWRIQGTAKKSGTLETPDFYLQNTAFAEYNWSASLGMERKSWGTELFYSRFQTKVGIFRGSHIGNLSDLRRIIASGETITDDKFSYRIEKPRQEVSHQLFSMKAWKLIEGLGKIQAQYGYQYNHRFEFDVDKPYNDSLAALDRPELELRLYTQTADLNLETKNFRGFTFSAGLAGMLQDNQYGGARYFVPNYKLYNGSVYGLTRWRKNKLEAEAGFRYDYREQKVYQNVNGVVVMTPYSFSIPNFTGGLLYKSDSATVWSLNMGTAKRAPSINEWFSNGLHHGTATFETGDPSLGMEKAMNAMVSYRHQATKWSMEAGVYCMFIADYIYLVPDTAEVLTISGAFPSFEYRHVDASFKGLDLTIDYDLTSRLNVKSRNSLVFARNESADRYLELVPSPRFDQLITWSFRKTEHWDDLSVGCSMLHVMEQTRYESGSDYIDPPPAYTLFGLEFTGEYSYGGQSVRFGLSVNNLLNTRYRDYMNRLRYYSDELGRNIIFRITVPLSFHTAAHDHEH